MAEITRAAQKLISQVQQYNEDASYEVTGEPDGLDTYRSITFDSGTTDWLSDALEAIDDERIESTDIDEGCLVVTFVGDRRADFADPYPLDEVLDVLEDEQEGTETE